MADGRKLFHFFKINIITCLYFCSCALRGRLRRMLLLLIHVGVHIPEALFYLPGGLIYGNHQVEYKLVQHIDQ